MEPWLPESRWLQGVLLAMTVCAAGGFWLMLPGGRLGTRRLGMALNLVAFALLGSTLPRLGSLLGDVVFFALAAVTVFAAAATVTSRSPVYSAIWFGLTLLGTAGLFLYQGAQFLGVATVVVYAGAILVTFLFVLMLAQPQGQAYYDRISWEAWLSAPAGALLIGMLTAVVTGIFAGAANGTGAETAAAAAEAHRAELQQGVLADQHVAHFGAQLFSRHLIAVEAAGALLLAALVGAVAIVGQGKTGAEAEDAQDVDDAEGARDAAF